MSAKKNKSNRDRKSVMKHTILSRLIVTACLAAACSVPPKQELVDIRAAEEAAYLKRFEAYSSGNLVGLNAYDPLAPVKGAAIYQPLTTAGEPTISQEALDAVERYARERNSSSMWIVRNGLVELETHFGNDSAQTLQNSRSLAKPLGVIAIGRAIEEGFIGSLDQSAADFITEWQGTEKAAISIRYLLDMRSGLLPQGQAQEPENVLNRAYLHPRHDEVIINEYPLVGVPGERYDYANANAELVAVLIERATGIRYEHWLTQQVFTPLGALGGNVWMNRQGGTAHAGCCILLPSETYLRLAMLYLQDGVWDNERLLPEGFVREVATATPQNPHAGIGVYVAGEYIERRGPLNPDLPFGQNYHSEPYLAADLFLFDGNGHQVAYIIPSANLVILRTGGRPSENKEWDNTVLPNTVLRGIDFADGAAPTPQSR